MTCTLRSPSNRSVRGSVWLVVWLVVVFWVWLCVKLKESNAHAHRRNAKKQTISHTHKNKKSTPTPAPMQRSYYPYIIKKPFNTYILRDFMRLHARRVGETVCLCISYTPTNFFTKYLPYVQTYAWHD